MSFEIALSANSDTDKYLCDYDPMISAGKEILNFGIL